MAERFDTTTIHDYAELRANLDALHNAVCGILDGAIRQSDGASFRYDAIDEFGDPVNRVMDDLIQLRRDLLGRIGQTRTAIHEDLHDPRRLGTPCPPGEYGA